MKVCIVAEGCYPYVVGGVSSCRKFMSFIWKIMTG